MKFKYKNMFNNFKKSYSVTGEFVKTYYPEVEIKDYVVNSSTEEYNQFSLYTCLRKQNTNGEWYLWNFYRIVKLPINENTTQVKIRTLELFHKEIYNVMILGKINSEYINTISEEPIFKKDTLQITEKERLEKLNKL